MYYGPKRYWAETALGRTGWAETVTHWAETVSGRNGFGPNGFWPKRPDTHAQTADCDNSHCIKKMTPRSFFSK